jgi:hypothetical protein
MSRRFALLAMTAVPIIAVGALVWGLNAGSAMASPAEPGGLDPTYINEAADWLIAQQQANGSFPGLFSDASTTCEAVLALVAAGRDPNAVVTNTNSPLDFLALQVDSYTTSGWDSADQTALLVHAVAAAGQNPYDFGGMNLVDRLNSYYNAGNGTFGQGNWSLANYVLALGALRHEIPVTAVNTLTTNQLPSGAWEYLSGWGDDLDTTAKVLQALAVAGEPLTSTAFVSATQYYAATQQPHGGWQQWYDTDVNPNSTGMAIQGLVAAGKNPLTYTVSISGYTPIDALLMRTRNAATGAFQYGGVDDVLATVQIMPGLQGQTFPYHGRAAAYHEAVPFLAQAQQPDGSFLGMFGTPDAGATLDVVLGGVAADYDPRDWAQQGITTPLDYLATAGPGYTTPYTGTYGSVYTVTAVAQTGKLIAGVVAAEAYTGTGTAYFAGIPLKERLDNNLAYSPPDNSVSDYAWAAIGYAALGETVPSTVTDALLATQEITGGWQYYEDYAYATSLAVQGLIAAGVSPNSTEMVSATNFLHTLQDPETGGFIDGWGMYQVGLNETSTANALQAIAALGLTPQDFAVSSTDGTTLTVKTPDQWLLRQQSPQGDFDGTALATGQVMQGLAGRALPIYLRPVVISTGLEDRTDIGWRSTFQAVFNTELDPTSVNATTFSLEGPGGAVPCAVSYVGRTATLSPTVLLQGGEMYRLTVDGVEGARLGATGPAYHWDVTTAIHYVFMPAIFKQ